MMCGFNRCCPRIMNNNCTVVVPAVPIQAGITATPMVGGIAQNVVAQGGVPAGGIVQNVTVGGGCPTGGGVMPSGTVPSAFPSGFVCNANFETVQSVMEPTVFCEPTIINHHNRVQHFVPCVKTNIHHVHTHNEWIPFEQEEVNQVVNHSHGVRPTNQQLCNSV